MIELLEHANVKFPGFRVSHPADKNRSVSTKLAVFVETGDRCTGFYPIPKIDHFCAGLPPICRGCDARQVSDKGDTLSEILLRLAEFGCAIIVENLFPEF